MQYRSFFTDKKLGVYLNVLFFNLGTLDETKDALWSLQRRINDLKSLGKLVYRVSSRLCLRRRAEALHQ